MIYYNAIKILKKRGYIMNSKLTKLLSIFLTVCLFFGTIGSSTSFAASNKKTVTIDGISYTYIKSGNNYTIINNKTHKKATICVDVNNKNVTYTEYKYENNKYVKTKKDKQEIYKPTAKYTTNATYNKNNKVVCKYETSNGNHYWYNVSTSKPKCVKIGCVKTYSIKYKTHKDDLRIYMDSIINCNNNYDTATAYLGTTDVATFIAILAAVATGTVLTDGAFLAILGLDFAGVGTGLAALRTAHNEYIKVKTYYNILKG